MSTVQVIDRIAEAIRAYIWSLARMILNVIGILALFAALGFAAMTVFGLAMRGVVAAILPHELGEWPIIEQGMYAGLVAVSVWLLSIGATENSTIYKRPTLNVTMDTSRWS